MSIKTTLKSLLKTGEVEHNPLTMSDEQILEQIYSTHVHSDKKLIDEHSLFTLVKNTLKRSTLIVDNVVQGSKANLDLDLTDDGKNPQVNFASPLCTLRQISSEMSCKPPSEEIAHKTTLSILNKLSHNEWDAKAVLTLAAFALEYGEFWLLAQHESTDLLAKSVAVLKRVPILSRPSAVQKYRQAIVEINSLVKTIVQVIELILQFDSFAAYDTKDVPALEVARQQIPVDVYWSIITIAAIVTQIDCLTTESEKKQELSHYGQKINIILSRVRKQISLCNQQIEEINYFRRIKKLFQTPTEITEVLKVLIFPKLDAPQLLYDGATKTTVDITVLKKKNVYLFISTLEITEEEFSVVKTLYESIKTNEQYKIVWIPVVEEWTEQLLKKFEVLKSKLAWYVVHNLEIVAGYKYIKEEWGFKKKPLVVVLSPQGKVEHSNAFHLIHFAGIKGFPFTKEDENKIDREVNWVVNLVDPTHPVNDSFKQGKYVFFYGGNDKEWIQQFTKYATTLINDTTIKEANISIELFCVEKEDKNFVQRFWSGIESLFVTKANRKVDAVTQEVQKMLSYKNETGWALLSKGSSVVVSGHGTTILKTVAEFEKWKELLIKKGSFDVAFTEYHKIVVSTTHRCSHLEIPIVTGKLPETIKCPECPNVMEIYISYKCCHNKSSSNTRALF